MHPDQGFIHALHTERLLADLHIIPDLDLRRSSGIKIRVPITIPARNSRPELRGLVQALGGSVGGRAVKVTSRLALK